MCSIMFMLNYFMNSPNIHVGIHKHVNLKSFMSLFCIFRSHCELYLTRLECLEMFRQLRRLLFVKVQEGCST